MQSCTRTKEKEISSKKGVTNDSVSVSGAKFLRVAVLQKVSINFT